MKTVIFAGPSITRKRLGEITGDRIENPIRRGDLETLGGYERFVILDGEFGQSLSVSPKEILKQIDDGKVVIGASSMGALRASELDTYGMVGIGWVYERFARAYIRNDDDVALSYSPLDFTPLTVPMVNIAYWMEDLCARCIVTQREANLILKYSRKIFFAERTEQKFFQEIEGRMGRELLERMLRGAGGSIPDIKLIDAEKAVLLASDSALR